MISIFNSNSCLACSLLVCKILQKFFVGQNLYFNNHNIVYRTYCECNDTFIAKIYSYKAVWTKKWNIYIYILEKYKKIRYFWEKYCTVLRYFLSFTAAFFQNCAYSFVFRVSFLEHVCWGIFNLREIMELEFTETIHWIT